MFLCSAGICTHTVWIDVLCLKGQAIIGKYHQGKQTQPTNITFSITRNKGVIQTNRFTFHPVGTKSPVFLHTDKQYAQTWCGMLRGSCEWIIRALFSSRWAGVTSWCVQLFIRLNFFPAVNHGVKWCDFMRNRVKRQVAGSGHLQRVKAWLDGSHCAEFSPLHWDIMREITFHCGPS